MYRFDEDSETHFLVICGGTQSRATFSGYRPSRLPARLLRPLNTWDRDVVNTMLRPVEQVAISRLIGYLYSAASLSADRNPVW